MDFKIVQIPTPFVEPTNVIRIGNTILDTGHVDDASTSVLLEQLESGDLRGVGEVIITHPHIDHAGASAGLPKIGEMPHIIFKGAERVLEDMSEYLWEFREEQERFFADDETLLQMVHVVGSIYFPAEREYHPVNVTRIVESGDKIPVGDINLRVIYTPGHEPTHMALFHEPSGTLFSGDLILNSGHFSIAPLTSDVAAYERSLEKVLDLGPKLIVPSHGNPIENAVEHVNKCVLNSQNMKGRVLETLERLAEATHSDIAKDIFDVTDPSKAGTLSLMVWCYLECLAEEGMISLDKDAQIARLE